MDNKSYKQIFKATTLFGSVQLVTVISNIIKVKAIAVFVGTQGIGLFGILTNIITLISALTSFGIQDSSIKYIAENNINSKRENIISAVKILTLLTSILGGVVIAITFIFFNDLLPAEISASRLIIFISLFLGIIFYSIDNTQIAILQGLREIKKLAIARVLGSFINILICLPVYYLLGLKGISISIFIVFFSNAIISYYFLNRIKLPHVSIDFHETLQNIKKIITLGFSLAISTILVLSVTLLIRTIISNSSSLSLLGLYEASVSILNGYVGLIFVVMSKDYFPRLAEIGSDNNAIEKIANQQIELGIIILLPIITFLITFIDPIINLLFSNEFSTTKIYLYWAVLGIYLKLISWSLSYIVLSKGNGKAFVFYEIIGSIIMFITHYLGFIYAGLKGLGIAFTVYNFLYLIIVYYVVYKKYSIKIENKAISLMLIAILITIPVILLRSSFHLDWFNLLCTVLLLIIAITFTVFQLDKRIKLFKIFRSRF